MYKFEKEELLQLLVRAYNEGNCGFLDLAESVAEKLIKESEDRQIFSGVTFAAINSHHNLVQLDKLVILNSNEKD